MKVVVMVTVVKTLDLRVEMVMTLMMTVVTVMIMMTAVMAMTGRAPPVPGPVLDPL